MPQCKNTFWTTFIFDFEESSHFFDIECCANVMLNKAFVDFNRRVKFTMLNMVFVRHFACEIKNKILFC